MRKRTVRPDKAPALLQHLMLDLKAHLDPYQFSSSEAGKPIWPDATPHQVAAHALVSKIFSKLTSDGKPSSVACEAALEKFISVNDRCATFQLSPQDCRDEELIGDLRFTLYKFFNPDGFQLLGSPEEIISKGGVGPGASVSARGDDLYTKVFDSPLSFTKPDLLHMWESTVTKDERWLDALLGLYARRIPCAVRGNKLSFVSKNDKVARTICTEPTINMWHQLGIGNIMSERLSSFFGIRLSRQQTINRNMARRASLGADLCTIDLESASDSVSMGLLEEILPREVFNWLRLTRSEETQLPDGRRVTLNMVSTMGNGFTFPLQTVIFAAIVATVYRHLGIPLIKRGSSTRRNFAVFGDDILCTKLAFRTVVRLLNLCGFKVNDSKSFSEGSFYESCGGDYFRGRNVRPFYAKALETDHDLYKTVNGLVRWSASQGILLNSTVQQLIRWMGKVLYVPPYEADDAGVHVPLDQARVKHVGHGIQLYYRAVPIKQYLLVKEDVILCGRAVRKRGYNPDGLWLSFLHGSVRGWRISLRQREVRYTTKPMVSSYWNTVGPQCRLARVGWLRWSNAAGWNLLAHSE